MKKSIFYSMMVVLAGILITSCSKNNAVYDKEVIPPAFARIATWNNNDTLGTYVVTADNKPFKIPIGITNVADVDRTISFTYASTTAVRGEQFNAPESIVIKAGQALDSLEITGIFDGFEEVTRVDKLTITISGGDVPAQAAKKTYVLTMKKYWVAPTDIFGGVYTIQDYYGGEPDGGAYECEVNLVSANGPVLNMEVIGLWGSDVPLKFTMTWTDLTQGTTVVPQQTWDEIPPYGVSTVKTVGTGTFTVDPEKLSISYNPTVAAGSFGNYVSVLTKE